MPAMAVAPAVDGEVARPRGPATSIHGQVAG